MIAVGVVGLLMGGCIGGYRLKRWHDDFSARAQDHARLEFLYRTMGSDIIGFLEKQADLHERTNLGHLRACLPRKIAYQEAMTRKYRRAANYPWLPVEPDPPSPE
jgi:hypothetical protein